ncbi:acetyl-CoA carboxylase biotin carboxyl carrier protein subunit [Neobacillus sp. LXY-4]|uniref:acetyl-CoA carboxylase biotin carboxyl carrier protein subunit n=1 Tax=Neobacillus sp. LXY-4 TaxID=3379826 RepID=UPI003EE1E42E
MEIKSRMPGVLLELKVAVGDAIKTKDIVAVMEAMKMKQPLPSPVDGVVKEIKFQGGDRVDAGSIIMVIE